MSEWFWLAVIFTLVFAFCLAALSWVNRRRGPRIEAPEDSDEAPATDFRPLDRAGCRTGARDHDRARRHPARTAPGRLLPADRADELPRRARPADRPALGGGRAARPAGGRVAGPVVPAGRDRRGGAGLQRASARPGAARPRPQPANPARPAPDARLPRHVPDGRPQPDRRFPPGRAADAPLAPGDGHRAVDRPPPGTAERPRATPWPSLPPAPRSPS